MMGPTATDDDHHVAMIERDDEDVDEDQDVFSYINQEKEQVLSKMEELESRRHDTVEEMAQHLLAFQSSSSSDESVFQRHAQLSMSLAALQIEQKHHKQRFDAVDDLYEKKEIICDQMQTRLHAINGESDALSTDELRQIVRSQASATLEVEVLNQERKLLEIQLKESKQETERLQINCDERDKRIQHLQQQNTLMQTGVDDSPSSSIAEISKISSLRSNLEAQSALVRKRLSSSRHLSSHQSPKRSPPSTVEIVSNTTATTNTSTTTISNDSTKEDLAERLSQDQQRELRNDIRASLRGGIPPFTTEGKERTREVSQDILSSPSSNQSPNSNSDEEIKAREKRMRERSSTASDSSLGSDGEIKAREKRLREQRDSSTRSLNTLQEKTSWVLGVTDDDASVYTMANSPASSRHLLEQQQLQRENSLASIPEGPCGDLTPHSFRRLDSRVRRQARRSQGELGRLSTHSQHDDEDDVSRSATVETTSLDLQNDIQAAMRKQESAPDGTVRVSVPQQSAESRRPGAIRVAPSGGSVDDSDVDESMREGEDETDRNGFLVSAILVNDGSQADLEALIRERELEERERLLQEREAALAQQAQSLRSLPVSRSATLTAAVSTVATLASAPSAPSSFRSHSTLGTATAEPLALAEFYPALMELGPGPLRFHPQNERPMRDQFLEISDEDYECFQVLQQRWEERRKDKNCAPFSESTILRFSRNTCKRNGSFNLNKAWKAMKKVKERDLFLSASRLEEQLLSATLFPVPGLLSQAGFDMFYMKPGRYFPRKTKVRDVIDNLVYVMNTMLEKEHACKNGIGFMACMNDWKMVNFDVNYCYQFMMGLQAAVVPVAVELFLIVNPPSWFGVIWKIMRPMLAPSFRKKVKVIKEPMLPKYLMEGYEEFLPDDFATGQLHTQSLVQDFVTYRKHVEKSNPQLNAKATQSEDNNSWESEDAVSLSSLDTKKLVPKVKHAFVRNQFASVSSMSGTSDLISSAESSSYVDEDDDASIHCDIDGSHRGSHDSDRSSYQ